MSTDTETVAETPEIETQAQEVDQAEPQQEQAQGEPNEEASQPVEREEEKVPLTALQKERRKRQEAEQRARLFEEMQAEQLRKQREAQPPQEEEDLYEAATKADLNTYKKQIVREVSEGHWIKENPEKAAEVNEKLAEFLKQRPNLASAIETANNRYEEAWTLMNALTPRQQAMLKPQQQQVKKPVPGSPTGVPKAAGMNQSVDVMNMSDQEFNAWRSSQRKRR